jgi:hypothetical protein
MVLPFAQMESDVRQVIRDRQHGPGGPGMRHTLWGYGKTTSAWRQQESQEMERILLRAKPLSCRD